MYKRVPSKIVQEAAMNRLIERGVTMEAIAEIVYEMQHPYASDLKLEACLESVYAVMEKREIQHAILVGVELDILAEQNKLTEPLLSLIRSDEGLFGCDETLALGSVFGYGSIAVTTFGHLDKQKVGIIKQLDSKGGTKCNTFIDDLVCSIAASAAGRLAHRMRDEEEGIETTMSNI